MKTKTIPKARCFVADYDARYPAEVRYETYETVADQRENRPDLKPFEAVLLPLPTAKQAKALCRWMNKTEGEQRFAIAKAYAAFHMKVPSLSDAGFRGMLPARIVEACNFADRVIALYFGEGGQR